jgi:hypothetical protein
MPKFFFFFFFFLNLFKYVLKVTGRKEPGFHRVVPLPCLEWCCGAGCLVPSTSRLTGATQDEHGSCPIESPKFIGLWIQQKG